MSCFVFGPGFGNDVVTDFKPGTDHELSRSLFANGMSDAQRFNYVMSHASTSGADVVLNIDGVDTITMKNVTLSSLHSGDFLFT